MPQERLAKAVHSYFANCSPHPFGVDLSENAICGLAQKLKRTIGHEGIRCIHAIGRCSRGCLILHTIKCHAFLINSKCCYILRQERRRESLQLHPYKALVTDYDNVGQLTAYRCCTNYKIHYNCTVH